METAWTQEAAHLPYLQAQDVEYAEGSASRESGGGVAVSERQSQIIEMLRKRRLSRARHTRSYQAKIERGECGHCSNPLDPSSKSCCTTHLSFFRQWNRASRNSLSIHQEIAANGIPSPAFVKATNYLLSETASIVALLLLPKAFITKLLFRREDSCWHWVGPVSQNPKYPQHKYGQFQQYFGRENGKSIRRTKTAHRFSYETFVGPIPVGLDIDHLCENKLCVNPRHLEPVTRQENMIRVFMRREMEVAQ